MTAQWHIDEDTRLFLKNWQNSSPFIEATTSGSTGTPKTIQLPKADMLASAVATNNFFRITPESTLCTPLSANYIAGKMMAVRALTANCNLRMHHRMPLSELLNVPCTLLALVPAQLNELLQLNPTINQLSNIIFGGAPLSPSQEELLANKPWKSYATYGMTETCSHVALRRISNDREHGQTYHALPDINFQTDCNSQLRIIMKNRSVRIVQTTDIVELLSPTEFKWIGRADHVINSGGIKIHPESLEKLLYGHIPSPFYIVGRPHERWGQAVAIVVENNSSYKTDELLKIVKESCLKHLPKLAQPKFFEIIDHLPLTSSGKLIRI